MNPPRDRLEEIDAVTEEAREEIGRALFAGDRNASRLVREFDQTPEETDDG